MKKYLLPILIFLMFMPLYVNAETCDTNKISISSITMENKSNSVEEVGEATVNGKNINLNLSMPEVGDNIEYKFVVKNDSDEDYELDKNSLNLKSDYINYSFKTDDNSNIVKANSSKNVTLRVEYKTEVPEDKFENGTYSDNKTMVVQLSNKNTINVPDTFKNPNTGVQSYIFIIFILLLISGSLYVLLKKKKYTDLLILLISLSVIIPISVYALCTCDITINSNITVKSKFRCASEILKTNYLAENDFEKSPYVLYNNTLYRVLYDLNSDIESIELISSDITENVRIKPYNSEDSIYYNTLISQLNEKTKNYVHDENINTRNVGTNPLNPYFEGNEYVLKPEDYTYRVKPNMMDLDDNYLMDVEQLERLGIAITPTSKLYCLSSRDNRLFYDYSHGYSNGMPFTRTYFYVRTYKSQLSESAVINFDDDLPNPQTYTVTCGIRPIIRLNTCTKIVSGDGTHDNPYIIENI